MPQHSNIIVIRTKCNMLYIITVNFSVTICIWFMRIKFIHSFNISHQLLSILSIPFMKNYFLYISIYVEISIHTILCGIEFVYVFIVSLYVYWCWRSSYQEGMHEIPLTNSTPSHFCTRLKRVSEFPPSYVVLFMLRFELKREVIFALLIFVELLTITV